jgi:2-polyprenyl-3-methyl-5-hydroxy-6-metoxy-1,4-benzoquinol methylase
VRISDALVLLGGRLVRHRFRQPIDHWRNRTWDGFRAEAHRALGTAYVEEREAIRQSIDKAASNACVLDVGAGTGRYSLDAVLAGATHVTALDVSPSALQELAVRASGAGLAAALRTRVGDFWTTNNLCWCGRPYEVVMCMDAIHHLGQLPDVLGRLKELAGPGGVVIGDVWTRDNFGEFQRARRGEAEHTLSSFRFLLGAMLVASGRRTTSDAVRSDLRDAAEVEAELIAAWSDASVQRSRYWVRFVAGSGSKVRN